MTEHKPRPLEATLNHRILIPLTLMAMMAAGCETAELGPKPVWAGGDAPTISDAGVPDTSSGDSAVSVDSAADTTVSDGTSSPETTSTDVTQDAETTSTDVTQDAELDGAATDIASDLPLEDLAQSDAPSCDPGSDPTCAGALAPTWQLENVAQGNVGFGETYGLEAYTGTVTVLALLTGG